MKSIPSALLNHLKSEVTTLATCWKVTRHDGQVFAFTDHVEDLVIEGVTYRAATGYTPTAVATSADLAVDNLDVEGLLDDPAITEADLMAGKWDDARVEIFQINYRDPALGKLFLRAGHLGEVRVEDGRFIAELRGLTQALARTLGELYSPICRADLGDARCKVNLAAFTVTGSVTATVSNRVFEDSARTETAGWFDYGLLTWTSGANVGLSMEVKTYIPGQFELTLPMPYAIAVGDGYSVYAGCQKRLVEDCKNKFGNVVNFRGEPHIPGLDQVLRGP
ncbi:MAG: DUF2163 domain-containing protein [Pseudomonadota bacterium]